ncbi:hypothetical protein [Nonomuraea antimicrobica]|uniref:hypothetical protein n=1 Tax=Nonomuraea antimicrobica TaxID=561173 RepID=UPI0031F078DC
MQSASASAAAFRSPVEPCDVGEQCELTPETTVTVTTTLGSPPPTDDAGDEAPETTVTKTVTATPTKASKTPTPKKTTSSPPAPIPETTPQNPAPIPSAEVPPVISTTPTPEASVEMPAIAPTTGAASSPLPSQTQAASTEEVPLELRNAAPEFDQRTLTQNLSIPALVLVLLVLFAVLIFEGRLRRMAHAAAVRRAGPQMPRPDVPPAGGYPAGPGYATAGFAAPGYPGGTAYAPIISFVPVQTYPPAPPQYGYLDPNHPYPSQGYMEPPGPANAPPEPVVLHPDEFDSYSEPPRSRERDPFEPLVPPAPPPSDIPPGGASPYDPDRDQPLGPVSAAEQGDSEPWQHQQPGSLFDPAMSYDPPPYLPADGDVTAVQPLPPLSEQDGQPQGLEAASGVQGPAEPTGQAESADEAGHTKELPDPKRRLFGRKKK